MSEDGFLMLEQTETGISITNYENSEDLLDELEGHADVKFVEDVPPDLDWKEVIGDGVLILRYKIVVPKSIKVVHSFEIDEDDD